MIVPCLNAFALSGRVNIICCGITQGVASLALGYVLHWAFSPPLLNPKLEFLFASSPHLLFAKTVCFYLLPTILPSTDLLSAICKPSSIALPDGSGSSTGRQRQRYHCRPVKPKMLIKQWKGHIRGTLQ